MGTALLVGCPQGEMAPLGATGVAGTAGQGSGSGSTGGSGTAASADEGSGGGSMGLGPVLVECGDVAVSAVGALYRHQPSAMGGDGDFTWTAVGLPDGLSLDAKDGEITGVPTTAGTAEVALMVTDGVGTTAEASCTLTVNEGLGAAQPSDPIAAEACVTGGQSLLDLIVEGTGDGSPITCTVDSGTGAGRLPDGITVDPDTCQIMGTVQTDRFGVYAFIVRGEQNGANVYVPYCVTQDDAANTYVVDADHSGAVSVPDTPLVRFFDPTGSVQVGEAGDPIYTALDPTVCAGANGCFFGYSFAINGSPLDSSTFQVTQAQLVSDASPDPIGLSHGLSVGVDSVSAAFQTRPWIQNVTMRYCLATVGADCATSTAIAANGGAQLEISIIMFPQP